jgi:hypothetical protein
MMMADQVATSTTGTGKVYIGVRLTKQIGFRNGVFSVDQARRAAAQILAACDKAEIEARS